MLIHSVKTPRNITVDLNGIDSVRTNQITLLTGPNGCGKTDVLATIADVFHGALQHVAGATVHWSRDNTHHMTNSLYPDQEMNRGRVRLVAQTFSPFSRFPGIERDTSHQIAPIYARGHSSEEEYVCIGFNQHSHVDIRKLSLSIVENGILRLSDHPKAARVTFDVLAELGFKNGIELSYASDNRLRALIKLEDDGEIRGIEQAFEQFAQSGHFVVRGEYLGRRDPNDLRGELQRGHIDEIAEYVRGSISLIAKYQNMTIDSSGKEAQEFVYPAFHDQHGMSSDFANLQAFSLLRRLGFLSLRGCTLTPYSGPRVDLTQTSSGQQQLLCSIFGLAAALEDDAIVLIDEPELSLHPRWQMNFFRHLDTALEPFSHCHVIIATHSPLIAQAGIKHGAHIVPMGAAQETHELRSVSGSTKASVEGMLVDVFDTPISNSLHVSNEIFALITKAEGGSYLDHFEARRKLGDYLKLYQRGGEGSQEMTMLLNKAIQLLSGGSSSFV